MRIRDGYQTYELDYHPFDVVGWDGYVYPWTFSIHDFEPITGRIHMPPPSHQTFEGRNFVICSFCPRKLDFDPLAIPIPYHHSNLNSEEMIYYVSGNFGSRRGIEVGSVTLHPSGIPHGPHPGLAEKSIGQTETHELAVMCDTFHPLRLTKLAKELDDGEYAYSWLEERAPAPATPTRTRRRHLALLDATSLASPTSAAASPSVARSTLVAAATSGRTRSLELGPDRGEQRLAPGGGDAAADSQRPGVGDGHERGGREADRVERVCEHAAGPVVGLGLREQRIGLRLVRGPPPGSAARSRPSCRRPRRSRAAATAGEPVVAEAQVSDLAGEPGGRRGHVAVDDEAPGDARCRPAAAPASRRPPRRLQRRRGRWRRRPAPRSPRRSSTSGASRRPRLAE